MVWCERESGVLGRIGDIVKCDFAVTLGVEIRILSRAVYMKIASFGFK